MKQLFTLIAALFAFIDAAAASIESGKAYRIVSAYYPNGTICVGSLHGSNCYLYNDPFYKGESKDAYWKFQQQLDGSYTIVNQQTNQYITYSEERSASCKGLALSNQYDGDNTKWFLEDDGEGRYMIFTLSSIAISKGNNYWNQRVDGTYLLGTYSYATSENAFFYIVDSDVTPGPGPDPGPDPGPGPDPTPEPDAPSYTVLDAGADYYAVMQTGNRLTIIPKDYVADYQLNGHVLTLFLAQECKSLDAADSQKIDKIVLPQVTFFDANCLPEGVEMPSFASYKFNNKFNYQLFADVEAPDSSAEDIQLSVGGIGKWLTASFQFSHEGAAAYVGNTLQASKSTRQRFDHPIIYTVGYPTWRMVELRQYPDDTDVTFAYAPYGRRQTVSVDWLSDHPTTTYGVPRIDILMTDYANASWGDGRYGWGGEYFWLGQNGKQYYENAEITIDGGGVYPDLPATPIKIKGRGNSTWRSYYYEKNPYHFKFEEKQKPLGMTKGKHWVLLSNKQTGSMTTNAVGHRVAEMMGCVAPCHIVPVELYINDSYRGSYNLCEKTGFGNNSVSIDDETYAAMVELDTYNDEMVYKDDYYNLSTKMKEPDFDDYDYNGVISPYDVMNDWNTMLFKVIKGEDFTSCVDVERVAAYLAANELICNCELKHAKSVFAYSENVTDGFAIGADTDETPWVFGPLWDCDWAYGYEQQKSYFQSSVTSDYYSNSLLGGGESSGRARNMWRALRSNEQVDRATYYLWHDFYANKLPELIDFCGDYYDFAKASFDHNTKNETIATDATDYQQLTENAKQWLQKRADSIYKRLTAYDLPVEPVEPTPEYPDPTEPVAGQLSTVGIYNTLAGNDTHDGERYDLYGRRSVQETKGIVISGGRKVIKYPH